jgi:hypothetical protein
MECIVRTSNYVARHHQKRAVVVLGRDAWPCVPYLREVMGLPAQYFLLSRVHRDHSGETAEGRWLREVPPGALVVDTGYAGSIIDFIRTFDPSVEGALMSSLGHYPQILEGINHYDLVEEVEHLPKLIGVSLSYRGTKAVCSRPGKLDRDECVSAGEVVARNTDLLLGMGVPVTAAVRYARFTGVTVEERVGLRGAALRRHLRKVAEARGLSLRFSGPLSEEIAAALAAFRDYGQGTHIFSLAQNYPDKVREFYSAWCSDLSSLQQSVEALEAERGEDLRHAGRYLDPDDWGEREEKIARRGARAKRWKTLLRELWDRFPREAKERWFSVGERY